jgi:polysaccharide deacetylase 2 family uncharacterized protein YibQ
MTSIKVLSRLVLFLSCSVLTPSLVAGQPTTSDCSDIDLSETNLLAPEAQTEPLKELVIIIDDLGHSLKLGTEALALPGNFTVAVMPYTQHGRQLADAAHARDKEVILHAPMSNLSNIPLGSGGLSQNMSHEEFLESLHAALEQVPHAKGVNNHMGSDLTQRREQMAWLMQELRGLNLYFVDSRTSNKTIAATVAEEFNVPHLSRHIFLDHERSTEAIDANYKELLRQVNRNGMAVAIGHPHRETIDYLKEALEHLPEQGIRLVTVSEALRSVAAAEIDQGETVANAITDVGLADTCATDDQSRTSIPRAAI